MDDFSRVNGGSGGGVACGGYGLIVFIITCIQLFGTEKYDLKGEPNYCTVKDSATPDQLYLCAAAKFDYKSSACIDVYGFNPETSTNMTSNFNGILWYMFITSFLCCIPCCNLVLSLVSFIMIYVDRFSLIGKFCSGDFNQDR